jgi:hypothetical protein
MAKMGAELPNAATSRERRLFAGADFRARCARSEVRLTAQSRIFTRRMSAATDASGRLRTYGDLRTLPGMARHSRAT